MSVQAATGADLRPFWDRSRTLRKMAGKCVWPLA